MDKRKAERKGDEEILAEIAQTYVQRQVNPARMGCPPLQTIEAFARGELQWDVKSHIPVHLACCRECMMELKTFRDLLRS